MALDLYAGIPVTGYAAALKGHERLFGFPPTFVASDTEAVWQADRAECLRAAAIRIHTSRRVQAFTYSTRHTALLAAPEFREIGSTRHHNFVSESPVFGVMYTAREVVGVR